MLLREPSQIDVKGNYLARGVDGISRIDLSREQGDELMDAEAWGPMLEMYGRTMKIAVALTDDEGHLLGRCYNAQPLWTLVHGAIAGKKTGCPFCLTLSSHCTAVSDALRTGLPTITRDEAGLTHVAVPLSLDNHHLGAIIAGQVLDHYPDSLSSQRTAKTFGLSAQLLWKVSNTQRPVTHATLQMGGDLLCTLGHAFLQQRYGTILETQVAQSNLQFRLLVEGVTDYALFTTDSLGCVTSWNVGAQRMLGYSGSEIVGQHFSCMFTFEDIQNGAPEKQLLDALQDGRTENEAWRVRKNGSQLWANVIITPLAQGGQTHRGFVLVMQDVTDRRKAAIELETVREERITLQEQFLSHISHELRTPLTALYFFITNLLEGVVGDLTSGQREHLEFSLENVKQLKGMVSDLLDVSRIESLKLTIAPQCTFVTRLIDEVLRTCRANAALKNIRLLSDIAQCPPSAWADRDRTRQVLINLIDNGIKFTPHNGTVTLRAESFAEDASFICLSVIDTGCGISPENCDGVFDRLSQIKAIADPSHRGLGLGLFISKELVSRQGGRIWVDSQVGYGSTFHFTLPVFSLAKFCGSILSPTNLAAGCVTLFSIDVPTVDADIQAEYLAEIPRVLEHCIRAGQDLLLPPMTEAETVETFFIIAFAETSGADAITKRLREELDDFDHSKIRLKPSISVTTLQLSANGQESEQRIVEVVSQIDKLIQAHLFERRISDECKENSDC